jgi:hypothetical protein
MLIIFSIILSNWKKLVKLYLAASAAFKTLNTRNSNYLVFCKQTTHSRNINSS